LHDPLGWIDAAERGPDALHARLAQYAAGVELGRGDDAAVGLRAAARSVTEAAGGVLTIGGGADSAANCCAVTISTETGAGAGAISGRSGETATNSAANPA
jgi:hypothetical protein